MLFPQLSNMKDGVVALLNSRKGNNRLVSELTPWMRVSSAYKGGLSLESISQSSNSFSENYGNFSDRSGKVGTNFKGEAVYAEGDRIGRPSPIIEALSVSYGAGGLSRKTTFAIKCFTLAQAEKVMEHFNEPGFTVLVEWGWNDNDSLAQKAPLNKCVMAAYNNFNYITEKEKNSNYKYSGFLGFITGGGLQNGEGETYTVDVELTTIGEIPAYLQTHTGGDVDGEENPRTGKKFDLSEIEDAADDELVGKALFMQMYNRLPQEKQVLDVKNLAVKGTDCRGTSWAHEGNFINMDDEIREKMIEDLQDTNIETNENDSSAKIPEGVPLIANHSYIRLELAFEILNKYVVPLKPTSSGCDKVKTYNYEIAYKHAVCRAHPYMYSTDGSKLFIPNTKAPEFNLVQALTAKEATESHLELQDGKPKKTANLNQFEDDTRYAFPQLEPYNETVWADGVITQEYEAERWGYLRDLFINFEFFCEVIGRTNVVTKDVYYEILNGIASAVDNFWYFEINQVPAVKRKGEEYKNAGDFELHVFDNSLCTPDRSKFSDCPKFMSSGVDTPFLSSNLNINIPAAMKNSIIGKRNSTKLNVNSDAGTDAKVEFSGIFATEQDPVLDVLNSFKQAGGDTTDETGGGETSKPDEDEVRKTNYELFMQFATVVPKVKDREGDFDAAEGAWYNIFNNANASLEDIVIVGAWSDKALFKKLYKNQDSSKDPTNILIPIKFEFETFGLTGINTGELFKIIDLPKKYSNTAFQVVNISHELSNNLWKTKVEGQLRNFS